MPYHVVKVTGGYKVAKKDGTKLSSGKKYLSDRPLTKAQAEKQKKAVEIAESKKKPTRSPRTVKPKKKPQKSSYSS